MIQIQEANSPYSTEFERIELDSRGNGQSWLLPVRKAAMARFLELGFPTTREEEWRFTNVATIAKTVFEPAGNHRTVVTVEQIEGFLFGDANVCRLVFVNGRYSPQLSETVSLPKGVTVRSLSSAMETDGRLIQRHLTRHAAFQDQAFTALNTALMEDGAFVHVPRGIVVEHPVHILHVSTAAATPSVTHPRNLIVVEVNSQISVIETYAGLGGGPYFTNAVTEIVAEDNAVVDYYKVIREGERAHHIATLQIHQYRGSNTSLHTVAVDGALVRNDINAVLDGEGGDCTLNGLSVLGGEQHVDNHLRVEHARPHCNSREFFKNILDDAARSVFCGRIVVHTGAQQTDAKQTNMNLLLSKNAQADSKPQLEIFADDVKCTHGVTIGQIDKDAVFYLCSRGLSEPLARDVLVYAFAHDSISGVRVEPLRAQLEELLFERLPQGRLLREAVA